MSDRSNRSDLSWLPPEDWRAFHSLPSPSFCCWLCARRFQRSYGLAAHLACHKPDQVPPAPSAPPPQPPPLPTPPPAPGKTGRAERHRLFRYRWPKFFCEREGCGRMFGTIEGLTEHHRTPHVRCPDCRRKFTTHGQMWRHSRDAHGAELYEERLAAFRKKTKEPQARRSQAVVEDEFQLSLVGVPHPQRQLDPSTAPGRSLPFVGGTATMLCILLAPSALEKRVGFWDFEHHRCAPFLPLALPFVATSAWPAARAILDTLDIPEFTLGLSFGGDVGRDRRGLARGHATAIKAGLPALQALLRRVIELFPAAVAVAKGRSPPGLQFHFEGLGPLPGATRCYTVESRQEITVPVRGLYYLTSTNNGPYYLHDFVPLVPGATPDYPDCSPAFDRWYYAPGQAAAVPELAASPLVARALPVPRRGRVGSEAAFVQLQEGVVADQLPGLVEVRRFATPYFRSLFDPPSIYWSADEDGEVKPKPEEEEEEVDERSFAWVRLAAKPSPVACDEWTHCSQFYQEVARLRPANSPPFLLWCNGVQLPDAWQHKVFEFVPNRTAVVEIEDGLEAPATGGLWADLEPQAQALDLPTTDGFFDLFS